MNPTNSKVFYMVNSALIYPHPHVLPEHSIRFQSPLSDSTKLVVTHILLSHSCPPAYYHVLSGYLLMLHREPHCCHMCSSSRQPASPLHCGLVVKWFAPFLHL